MPEPLLIVRGLEAGYRNRQILFGVDLDVGAGEAVALLGANGSGKSTLLAHQSIIKTTFLLYVTISGAIARE
jgi:ABC-type branched-subunit amino acid transport system ATPase component